ncbi:hypothetical protein ScPMuIL_004122 [Solemya velum]
MVEVSIILPVYNAARWLDDCLQSVLEQRYLGDLELSIYNDASTDSSKAILNKWMASLEAHGIHVILTDHPSDSSLPKGVGFAKNRAIEKSSGKYLCFLDADDVMHKDRIVEQLEVARRHTRSIIGSCFHREPVGSTQRFTDWANGLSQHQLLTQIYTSHGPTVIMPTWFCSRNVYDTVGSFHEGGKGVPEDLVFFYKHLEVGGTIVRVDQDLMMYRYHSDATTFSVSESTIWQLRLDFLEKRVLSNWERFTIWNAGKQGRRFYRSLSESNRQKVAMFCDVDERKISKGYYTYEESTAIVKPKIPVVHFRDAQPPFIICVKLDLTKGDFENNLKSLNLKEVDKLEFEEAQYKQYQELVYGMVWRDKAVWFKNQETVTYKGYSNQTNLVGYPDYSTVRFPCL